MCSIRSTVASRLREHQCASLHVAVTAEVLGARVQHDVGAELQGPLQDRRPEGSVHDELRARAMSDLGDGGDVDDVHQRIGRSLHPDQPCVGSDRVAQRAQVAHVHELGLASPALEHFGADDPEGVIDVVVEEDVAPVGERLEVRTPRRHPRGEGQRRGASLQRRERLLQA